MPAATSRAASSTSSSQKGDLAVVLDIDGTLIDSDRSLNVWKRPGVDAFLDSIFVSCAAVAIWTHAGESWASQVIDTLRDADGKRRPWSFVWCSARGVVDRRRANDVDAGCYSSAFSDCYIKPLQKIWKGARRRALGFTPARTLIIEDTPPNCARNYGNAIYVPTYEVDVAREFDDVLPALAAFIDVLQRRLRCDNASVRSIEKRNWYSDYRGGRFCCCATCLGVPSIVIDDWSLQPTATHQPRTVSSQCVSGT
jgi:hypothetical protein